MSRLVIDGDKVTLVREVVEKTTTYDDFMAKFLKDIPISIPFLPRETLGFVSKGKSCIYTIHQEPRLQTIKYCYGVGANKETINLRLNLPHVYFMIECTNNPATVVTINIFFSTKEINTIKDPLGNIPFPNVHPGDRLPNICLGTTSGIHITDDTPLHLGIGEIINGIWTSLFNNHLIDLSTAPDILVEAKKKVTPKMIKDMLEKKNKPETTSDKDALILKYLYAWSLLSEEEAMKIEAKIQKPYGEWLSILQKSK